MTDTLLIQRGDIVTLKSGGPAMTVEGLFPAPPSVAQRIGEQSGQMARVAWADATGVIHDAGFWLHMLVKKADDPEPKSDAPAPRMKDR